MTTPINAGNPYGVNFNDVAKGEQLTGDALMLYVKTRLNSLDTEINKLMGQQEESLDTKEWLNEFEAYLEEFAIAKENDAATLPTPPVPPNAQSEKLYAEINKEWKAGLGTKGAEGARTMINTTIKGLRNEVDGSSELNMIRLQQLMGQRQMAVQLSTNLMSKVDETQRIVSGNI